MKAIAVFHNTQSYKFLFNVGPSPAPDHEARHLSRVSYRGGKGGYPPLAPISPPFQI